MNDQEFEVGMAQLIEDGLIQSRVGEDGEPVYKMTDLGTKVAADGIRQTMLEDGKDTHSMWEIMQSAAAKRKENLANRKPLDHYLNSSYPFLVVPAGAGEIGYVIVFGDLPGCLTQVDTAEEVLPMAEDARRLWIETEYARGSTIPEPGEILSFHEMKAISILTKKVMTERRKHEGNKTASN